MNGLTADVEKLKIGQKIDIGFGDDVPDEVPSRPSGNLATESHDTPHYPDEVPFRPPGNLAAKLPDTPRYLFRVFSDASEGENSSKCMKSVDAVNKTFEDIFARDPLTVALTLNEHLRWQKKKSYGDPFISWTTSLLNAIQYAIYKHKKESTKLSAISLCIVDTTLFPNGVFMEDLDLIEKFIDKGHAYNWGNRGLDNLGQLRNKQHQTYSGVYYFGEYLSQGQTNIEGRSCTVTCDKIINSNLFAFMPQFEDELEDKSLLWANTVIKLRQPFYITEQEEMKDSDFSKAMIIALKFDTAWFLPMFANLLALSPRMARDPTIIGRILEHFRDEVIHHLLPKVTNVVANDNIPEVFHFGKIIHGISEDYYAKSVAELMSSMGKTTGASLATNCDRIGYRSTFPNANTSISTIDIIRHFIRDSRTAGGRKMLGTGDLATYLPTVDHSYVQPLMRSLKTLSGILQELQEDTT
ncbi:hypothetical protein Trihar35433_6570 [Trichoderma harzianum]|nr:hypothetical protein Trihar35433_6570 [Trichoderma harzianum]